MRVLILLLLCSPGLARAEARVLVNAIPSGGVFFGMSPVGLPFRDAETAAPKDIGAGLSAAAASMIPAASQRGISFICLLSSPGDNPVEVFIAPAKATLRLRRRNTTLSAVFFTGGSASPLPMVYVLGAPDPKRASDSTKFQKIAVPAGATTAGWIYFNLTRVQQSADKAAAAEVFLIIGGSGASSAIAIPGMKEPMTVFEDHATLTAAWYDPGLKRDH
jgi:hypothetical protein